MADILDIRKDGYYRDMLWRAINDEVYGINKRACEATDALLDMLCEQIDENHDIVGTFGSLITGNNSIITNDVGTPYQLNTYPFGEKGDLYPEFFGLSMGTTKLNQVFKEAIIHTDEYIFRGSKEVSPTITIFTDNWSAKTFEKYEAKLSNYVLNYGVYVYIYLFTGYGVTRIPFLCGKNVKQIKNTGKYNNQVITGKYDNNIGSLKYLMSILGDEIIIDTYEFPNVFERKELQLEADELSWYYSDKFGYKSDGKLKSKATKEFMQTILPYAERIKHLPKIEGNYRVYITDDRYMEGSVNISIPMMECKIPIDLYIARRKKDSDDAILLEAINTLFKACKIDVLKF